MSASPKKKVLVICGDYMEDAEVMVQFQALQAYGLSVDAVCPNKKNQEIFVALLFINLLLTTPETRLFIPGGRAPEYLALNEAVINLVKDFMEAGKPVASICHGQQILSAARVLKV